MKKRNEEIARKDAGFTLIEILLVVVIIGILAAVAVPRLGGRVGQSQIAAARAGVGAISTAIDLYETDKGSEPNWNGPYIRKAEGLKDPWGAEYQFTKQGNVYTVASAGPDGSFGSADDVK